MNARPIWDNRGVSSKLECPGCGSYSSTILRAFEDGEVCPACGLPATATAEILDARKRAADAELTTRYEEAVKRVGRLETENHALRGALNSVRQALRQADEIVKGAE